MPGGVGRPPCTPNSTPPARTQEHRSASSSSALRVVLGQHREVVYPYFYGFCLDRISCWGAFPPHRLGGSEPV